jgi:WD40 repeat protein
MVPLCTILWIAYVLFVNSCSHCRLRCTGHMDTVSSLDWDWTKVVTGSRDQTVRIWDISTGRLLETCHGHTGNVACVSLLHTHVVSASWDGSIRCWFGE